MPLPSASRRLIVGAACVASLAAAPSALALTTYDLTATGTVQYLRKEVFQDDRTTATTVQQAALNFTTTVTGLQLDVNHNLKSPGTPATTVSDVRGAYHATVIGDGGQLDGSCAATQGKVVVPGALGEPLLTSLTDTDLALRVFNQVDIPMTGCSGYAAADHLMSLTHWNEPVGESALDTLVVLPESAFQGDISTGELQVATPGARCPLAVEGITAQCSIAIQGQWTLTKTAATPPPKPDGPESPSKPIGGSGGKVSGSVRWAGDGKRVKLRVTCSAACRGGVSINLPGGGARIGAPVTIDLAAGESRTVSFKVTPAQRKVLEDARRIGLRYEATAGDTPTTVQKVPVTRGR